MTLFITILILVVVLVVLKLFFKERFAQALPYRRKDYFFTVAEKKFYDVLKEVADQNGYVVFAKVRLEDLLWLPKNTPHRLMWRGYVKSRHIDFVLCEKGTIKPVCAIELDDSSHFRWDRIKRDERIDKILESAGLPLLRFPVKNFYEQNDILSKINNN